MMVRLLAGWRWVMLGLVLTWLVLGLVLTNLTRSREAEAGSANWMGFSSREGQARLPGAELGPPI